MMSYYLYKHTSPSGKVYIGITSRQPEKRWQGEGSGYNQNRHFHNAIQKYGWDNFKHEILFADLTKEEACAKEIELIAQYKSNNPDFGYNHSTGGECSAKGYRFTEEQRLKLSEINKGKHSGSKSYWYGKTGELSSFYGRKHTLETKMKISLKKKGKSCGKGLKWSEESKLKNRLSQQTRKNVLQMTSEGEIVHVYNSIKETAQALHVNASNVSRWCTGERNPSNGFVWRFGNA